MFMITLNVEVKYCYENSFQYTIAGMYLMKYKKTRWRSGNSNDTNLSENTIQNLVWYPPS